MDNTDQETVEQLKTWWKQYGSPILAGLVIGGLLFGGFRFYNNSVEEKNRAASASYEQLMLLIEEGDNAQARQQIALINDNHSGTSYAGFAQLFLASIEVQEANYPQALQALEQAHALLRTDTLRDLIDLRRARVLLEMGNERQALALLVAAEDSSQAAQKLELRGDILALQGDFQGAREAYLAALEPTALIEGRVGLLNLKLNNLPADQ